MDTEQYIPEEAMSSAPDAQEAHTVVETAGSQSTERSRFHYRFDELIGDATDELEKALARFQEETKDRRHMDLLDILSLGIAIYKIRLELLMRNNPAVRDMANILTESGSRKIQAQKQWEKEILEAEGEEGLKRRKQNGEGPIHQYTREELDRKVEFTRTQVEAGILPPSALEQRIAERDAGGYYQWEKEFRRKNDEESIRRFAALNHPMTGQILENTRRLNEDMYGKDYAARQHAILAELVGIAAQKTASTPPDNTTV